MLQAVATLNNFQWAGIVVIEGDRGQDVVSSNAHDHFSY